MKSVLPQEFIALKSKVPVVKVQFDGRNNPDTSGFVNDWHSLEERIEYCYNSVRGI